MLLPIGPGEYGLGPPRYSLQDFEGDFLSALRILDQAAEPSSVTQALQDHFASKYLDDAECIWRRMRCSAALKYWMKHRDALGSKGEILIIPPPVLFVLWTAWTTETNDPTGFDPTIATVGKLVEHYTEKWSERNGPS